MIHLPCTIVHERNLVCYNLIATLWLKLKEEDCILLVYWLCDYILVYCLVRRLALNPIDFFRFTSALMYYALMLNTGYLPGDIFLNSFLLTVIEIPANFLTMYFLGRIGRRLTLGLSMIFGAISSVLMIPLMFFSGRVTFLFAKITACLLMVCTTATAADSTTTSTMNCYN